MAGIHEITGVSPIPKRRPKHTGDLRAQVRSHVARLEQLVETYSGQLATLERELDKFAAAAGGLDRPLS